MSTLRAGFGRAEITPKIGCQLVGYGGRDTGATGVHDPLQARALVLEDENGLWALISCDLLFVFAQTVAEIRNAVHARVGIAPERLFVATTHTHGGPWDGAAENWDRPLAEIIADAVEHACQSRQPARIGSGFGILYGYSINRRWLDRPIDPAVAVLRVDDAAGNLLGVVSVFGCHAVVLGYDNYLISGDWPGHAMTKLEESLGNDVTCLFFQGGAGDINPLVAGVRKQLESGRPIVAIGNVSTYYGAKDDPEGWNIGDRGGGTFEEVAELGDAYAREVLHVTRSLQTAEAGRLWSEQVTVNAAADPDERVNRPRTPLAFEWPADWSEDNMPAEIMILGIGDMVLVGQPGEVFSETGINLRLHLRALGYRTPALVSYANGCLLYLPEPSAFPEGGYEPNWALSLGISKQFQPRVRQAIEPVLQAHAPQ
jgi:neutral ceramidase